MQTYSDEYIEHMAEAYLRLGLSDCGVTFERFLQYHDQLDARPISSHFLPLNGRQEEIRRELLTADGVPLCEREVDHLPRRDGRIIEPLHHHAFPRHPSRPHAAWRTQS